MRKHLLATLGINITNCLCSSRVGVRHWSAQLQGSLWKLTPLWEHSNTEHNMDVYEDNLWSKVEWSAHKLLLQRAESSVWTILMRDGDKAIHLFSPVGLQHFYNCSLQTPIPNYNTFIQAQNTDTLVNRNWNKEELLESDKASPLHTWIPRFLLPPSHTKRVCERGRGTDISIEGWEILISELFLVNVEEPELS